MSRQEARDWFESEYGFEPRQVTADWVRMLLVDEGAADREATLWGASPPGPPPVGSQAFTKDHDHYLAWNSSSGFLLDHCRTLASTVAHHGYGSEHCLVTLCSFPDARGIMEQMDGPGRLLALATPPAWGVSAESEESIRRIMDAILEGNDVGAILPTGWKLDLTRGSYVHDRLRLALGLDGFGWLLPSGLQIIATTAVPDHYAVTFACKLIEGQERGFAAVAYLHGPTWCDYKPGGDT